MLDDSGLFTDVGQAYKESIFVTPLLDQISSQAAKADQTRSIDADLIRELKKNNIMRISASPEMHQSLVLQMSYEP